MKAAPVRILVVEDDPLIAELISTIIRNTCDEIETAPTMEDAINHLNICPYAAVLLDLKLPDSDPNQSLASVQLIKRMGAQRVVVITATPIDERLVKAAKEAGADDVIGKDDGDFKHRVRAIVG